jgi:uncharacterized glyoxalase superfamily protein PhnB
MADPFESMSSLTVPLEPDAAFSAQLRSRIARAFQLPKGVTVSNLTIDEHTEVATATGVDARPEAAAVAIAGYSLTPYLAVAGAERALSWYATALGAHLRGEAIVMPDGRIGHAELEIGGARFMLSEEHPEIGVVAPVPGAGSTVTLLLTVTDVDVVMEQALEAGADLDRPAADYDHGRNGVIRDPFGHRWMISALPKTAAPDDTSGSTVPVGSAAAGSEAAGAAGAADRAALRPALRQGDVGYVSLFVPDAERASRFFADVLGWKYHAGSGPQGRQIEGLNIHHGIWSDPDPSTLFLCFAVDDVAAAVQQVRAAGGTAEEPHEAPYGLVSECVDDAGVRFAVFQPPGGTAAESTSPDLAPEHGDLVYITMEYRSSAVARAFYGDLLGWTFTAGRVEDGWQVDNARPMVGISSGHDVPLGVPMYRVDDIAVAVERVRTGGGSATDPAVEPYGVMSQCTDDQGTRFYLGQLS